jgi:HEAT repeat protein
MMVTIVSACAPTGRAFVQERSNSANSPSKEFIVVEGGSLAARLESAVKLARGRSARTPFFVAYRFDVRPGVSVDMEVKGKDGRQITFDGVSFFHDSPNPSRNVAVFLRFAPDGGEPDEVRVYDIDRRHEFPSPVYWLGQAEGGESISYLTRLAERAGAEKVAERATMALAIHDASQVEAALVKLVRSAPVEKARVAAALWLGQFVKQRDVLAEIVRDERETREVRGAATLGIGTLGDTEGLRLLQNLHRNITDRSVREHILVAVFSHKDESNAIEFLIKLASDRSDTGTRKQALFWLGQKAGERSIVTLRETIDDSDEETEVQTHAVFALSQRPKDEAVPLLINIARTHKKSEVRKQAMFWLGQTEDERALEFFKEVLAK